MNDTTAEEAMKHEMFTYSAQFIDEHGLDKFLSELRNYTHDRDTYLKLTEIKVHAVHIGATKR